MSILLPSICGPPAAIYIVWMGQQQSGSKTNLVIWLPNLVLYQTEQRQMEVIDGFIYLLLFIFLFYDCVSIPSSCNHQISHSALQWCHNECDGISNHQPHDCLPNRLFQRRSKKSSKLRVTGLCAGNSPVTGEFPAQRSVTRKYLHLMMSSWTAHHSAECTQ